MKKKLLLILTMILITTVMAGCQPKVQEKVPYERLPIITIAALKGPTGMGIVNLMDENDAKLTKIQYKVSLAGAPDEIVAGLISGDTNVALIPTNLAATLYQKTNGEIQVAAINTLGVLSILEKGNTINSIADLKGKTIYATGQASTPQYVLEYLLESNGLKVGTDVMIEYKKEHSELATLMIAGDIEIAMMPEPFVTTILSKNPDMRIALDLTKEWKTTTSSELAMGCLVVRREYAEEAKKSFDIFLEEYANSVKNANESIGKTAELIAKYEIMPSAELAQKAIPNCNIVCIEGKEMELAMGTILQVFFEANPKSIGGTLPDEEFYYKK